MAALSFHHGPLRAEKAKMSGTLSPSEIQSLFGGLDLSGHGPQRVASFETSSHDAGGDTQFTLPLELAAAERHAWQAWQTRFAEQWQTAWPDLAGSRWSIVNMSFEVLRLRDFVAAHSACHSFQVTAPGRDLTHWVATDEPLAVSHLNCLLGATEVDSVATRPSLWGPLEHQLTNRLIAGVSNSLFPIADETCSHDWKIHLVEASADWLAGSPVFLSCEIVQFEFEIRCAGELGRLQIGLPRSLANQHLNGRSCSAELRDEVVTPADESTVHVRATLPPISLSQTEFNQLQVGDVLLTGHDALTTCNISLNGQTEFCATIGSHRGHKAIRLIAAPQ